MPWLSDAYPWIKALHVIAVIAWMAGLLYLPRLFVYHCGAAKGTDSASMLEIMELRLLRFIMNPAMIAAFVFGGLLLMTPGAAGGSGGWIHAKLALVLLLTLAHAMMSIWRKGFAAGANQHSAKFYRICNEVPTVLMIAIVILVIVKPF